MSNIYQIFETDQSLEREGVTLDLGHCKIRIAAASNANPRYLAAMEAISKKYGLAIDMGALPKDTDREIVMRAYAESIVLGWEGVTDRDGNPVEYSADACFKLFQDLPRLYEYVYKQANRVALFRKEVLDADAKN